ncbi:ribonucleoside-diphosphate reductase alpha chain [Gammaproteobacteria bacterium]
MLLICFYSRLREVKHKSMTKIYSFEEANKASVDYFNGDELAAKVWIDANALRDLQGNLLESNPEMMHRRLAKEFARIESKKFKEPLTEEAIFKLFDRFKYLIPQSSPMTGIGNDYQKISLSNCFVIEAPLDSYGAIMRCDEQLVQLSKRRGGVGTPLSNLRPAGTPTTNAARTSTGVVSFAERYSNSMREVAQNGRRGALMLLLDITHPECVIIPEANDLVWKNPLPVIIPGDKTKGERDIKTLSCYYNPAAIDFVSMKLDRKKVTGANISVALTDEFLTAVKENKEFEQRFPIDSPNPSIRKQINARNAWKKIIHMAWQSAEPGLMFWDRMTKYNAVDCYSSKGFNTISTNPCITGDTLVYLADGRGNVPIKQLAEEGNDVPVFCYDNDNKIVIRTMRHPRVTGYNNQVYKVTLEDGTIIRATSEHKLKLSDNSYKPVKDIIPGDSLKLLTRFEANLKDIFEGKNKSKDYYWINNGSAKSSL